MEVRLKNLSRQRIGYNLCLVNLEKKVDGQWSHAPVDSQVCSAILLSLRPGSTATGGLRLRETLGAGEYRITTTVEDMGNYERRDHHTNTFVVTP